MKINLFLAVATMLTATACSDASKNIALTNPSNETRADEVIVFNRQDIEANYPMPNTDALPVVLNGTDTIPSQLDDMDADGSWDEMAFLVNFEAKESKQLKIAYVSSNAYPKFKKRTNLRLGIRQADGSFKEVDHYTAIPQTEPFKVIAQGEGVSWENEKMAFRNYFDCRNLKDLFGKRQPGMIIDKVHTPAMGSYHDLADWGMDVLHCGNSLGAGGMAIYENDSLYRLGSTDIYEYQKVTEGPVRSVFDLIYKGWHVNNQNLSAVERISIYPGKYWFQSDVTVSGFNGNKQLVTGIVTSMLDNKPYHFKANTDFDVIATLGKQSLNNDFLGMAVMLKANEVTKVAEATKVNYYFEDEAYQTVPSKQFSNVISDTYYVAQQISNDKPARHYFAAVWELDDIKWKQIDNFKAYLSDEADKLSAPISVSIQ